MGRMLYICNIIEINLILIVMSKIKIENQAVFGCYSQKENKVTLALLKILEQSQGDALLRNLVEIADGEDLPNDKIELESQVSDTQEHSIPDGKISCHYDFQYTMKARIVYSL